MQDEDEFVHENKIRYIGGYDDECVPTATTAAQASIEESIALFYKTYFERLSFHPDAPKLAKGLHRDYLYSYLFNLPTAYQCLDCSRTWLCFWITHSLSLLKCEINVPIKSWIVQFLKRCQCEDGGFGGGPGQYAHLAPTYAAVNALCSLGTTEAYKIIDRKNLLKFLWSVRVGDGSFSMHIDGEVDIRSVYCALVVAKLTNIYNDKLFENSAEWIARCQTYEGGFSCTPGMEAHGGYSFCGIASLYLLSSHHLCNLKLLLRWTANKQMNYEGGFQGRTNKLVDGCYSFWQGASMALMHTILSRNSSTGIGDDWFFNNRALQQYILICCQDNKGGLRDKPKVPRDPYHTCYTLSGLSVAQNLPSGSAYLEGSSDNHLEKINPVFNMLVNSLKKALHYFNLLEKVTL